MLRLRSVYTNCMAVPYKTIGNNVTKNCFISTYTNYDIIVVGGGLIGATLACVLGKNNRLSDKRILLLEGSKKKEWQLPQHYSNRVSSLNQATCNLLNDIGVWSHIQSARYGTVKGMQVWESNSEAVINFKGDYLDENLAYIVENDITLHSVYKELQNVENVEVLHEALLDDLKLSSDIENHKLILKNGSKFSTKLLIGCDGYSSKVRQEMGVLYISHSYKQMGVVATLELEEECDNSIAWQKFLPTGPIALLPLDNKTSSLVWSTTPHHAKKLMSLTKKEFVDELNDHLWNHKRSNFVVEKSSRAFDQLLNTLKCPSIKDSQLPPKIVKCQESSRGSFPLGFGHATNYIQKGVALVGKRLQDHMDQKLEEARLKEEARWRIYVLTFSENSFQAVDKLTSFQNKNIHEAYAKNQTSEKRDAAHRVHPLAGQGANLGFGDIQCLNAVLGEAAYAGSELGELSYLKDYETQRQRHNVPTMLAIDGLYRLYGTEFPPVVLLRSLGLQAVNALGPLKGLLKSHAAS